jgi:hypothetical protein
MYGMYVCTAPPLTSMTPSLIMVVPEEMRTAPPLPPPPPDVHIPCTHIHTYIHTEYRNIVYGHFTNDPCGHLYHSEHVRESNYCMNNMYVRMYVLYVCMWSI